MFFRRTVGSIICLVVIALAAPGAVAQVSASARMAAKSYAPLPDSFSVAVDYREDSLLNSRLRAVFESALRDRGYRVGDQADFTLTFETLVEEKLSADRPASVFGGGGSSSGKEFGFELRLPLDRPKMAVGGRRFSLNVNLAKPGKTPAWVGSAVAVGAAGDRFAIQSALAEILVDSLGETVDSTPVRIQ